MTVWIGLALWLAVVCAFPVWLRIRRRSTPQYVLVSVARPRRWSTRPVLVQRPDQLELLRNVGTTIEVAGGHAKALLFLGQPTMDLIVEAADPNVTANELASRLADFPVTVAPVGRHGDLRWVRRLWRYL